jgi:rhodanese-related sulfurtransferase
MSFLSQLFNGGSDQLKAEQVHSKLQQNPRPYLIDVRQPAEYEQGHIHGAQLIPLQDLPRHISRLPRNREIICVCRSGHRSGAAVRQLSSAGIKSSNLKGGMISWKSAGLPVKKGRGQ